MKHVTIKDVAKALNVSISTISRAFNDKYDIHPDTKNMILEKAKEMGYSPNPIAQRLTQHKSSLIGVVVPEFVNAFFPKIIMAIQRVMDENGYQVLIMSSEESAGKELKNIRTLEKDMVDGLIISLTQETRDVSYFQHLLNKNIPIVQFNRVSQKLATPKIILDDTTSASYATEHLVQQGYRRIYHLSGPNNLIISHNRIKGFTETLKKYGLSATENKIIEAGIFIEDGKKIATRLIENGDIPEALFCFNDPVAIGAMEVFKAHNFRIPEDIAFMGFTESRIATHLTPALSSVEQPTDEFGKIAARSLLDIINEKNHISDKTIILSGKLNIRASSIRHK